MKVSTGSLLEKPGYRSWAPAASAEAILVENDCMAQGSREAMLEVTLKIPEERALVGFNEISLASLKRVEITTPNQKKHEMGSLAA